MDKKVKKLIRKAQMQEDPSTVVDVLDELENGLEEKHEEMKEKLTDISIGTGETTAAIQELKPSVDKMAQFLFEMKGDKGEDGITPVKGKDYFTPEEIQSFKKEVTPIKGVDYADGEAGYTPIKGVDYKDGKDGLTPKKGKDYFTKEEVATFKKEVTPVKGKDYFDGKDGKNAAPKDVIDEIKKLKGNDRLDISHIRNGEQLAQAVSKLGKLDMSDQRWHGGGGDVPVKNEGTQITPKVSSWDFVGNIVTATSDANGNVTVTINGDGTGDVIGPSSSTDNAIVRFDGTTGKIIQDYTSGAPTISDTGYIGIGIGFGSNTLLRVGDMAVDSAGTLVSHGVTSTATSGGVYALYDTLVVNPSSNSTASYTAHSVNIGNTTPLAYNLAAPVVALDFSASIVQDASHTSSVVGGINGFAQYEGQSVTNLFGGNFTGQLISGNATNLYGERIQIKNRGSGSVSYGYGSYIATPVNDGGGVFGNVYGLYIDNQTGGSNSYGMYLVGGATATLYSQSGKWRAFFGASDSFIINANNTTHTNIGPVLEMSVGAGADFVNGISCIVAATGDYNSLTGITGGVASGGMTTANDTSSAILGRITSHASDASGTSLISFNASFTDNGGGAQAFGYFVGGGYDYALFAQSGSVTFFDYNGSITAITNSTGNGVNIQFIAGDGVGTDKDAGSFLFFPGAATGTGAPGIVAVVNPADNNDYIGMYADGSFGYITGSLPIKIDVATTFTSTLTATAGGSLTGTWTNMGSVTTIDINGGTIDGTSIGASSASTGIFTNLSVTTASFHADDVYAGFGNTLASPDAGLAWNTTQTVDGLFLGLSAAQNTFIIAEYADRGFDFAHAAQTNPTLFIHSAAQSTTEYFRLYHDGTQGVIQNGATATGIKILAGNGDGITVGANATINMNGTAGGFFIWSNASDGGGIQFRPHQTTNATGFQIVNDPFGTGFGASSIVQTFFTLNFTTNQTGTAGYTANKIVVTETATGSGTKLFADWGTAGGGTLFSVANTGKIYTANEIEIDGNLNHDGSNIGFFGTAPTTQQTSGANLTNNVTSGGTDNTIADYSDLIIYANDAAAIRNDIYQLARKLKQVNDGLRAYGILT